MRLAVLICLLFAVPFAGSTAAAPEVLSGKAEVISGDTLRIAGTVLRLTGVDAPETGQHCQVATGRRFDCGRISATALMDLTVASIVSCRLTGKSRDGVPLAACKAGGYDLSKGMVHTGWALAWPRTGTIYQAVEAAARERRHGLWRGTFDMPWDWRRKKP